MQVAELLGVLQLLAWVFKVNQSCIIRDHDPEPGLFLGPSKPGAPFCSALMAGALGENSQALQGQQAPGLNSF